MLIRRMGSMIQCVEEKKLLGQIRIGGQAVYVRGAGLHQYQYQCEACNCDEVEDCKENVH